MESRVCPDCGAQMETGVILDFGHNQVRQSHWQPGTAEVATFFGIPIGGGTIKIDTKKMLPVTTYRCTGCHLLRSYAE